MHSLHLYYAFVCLASHFCFIIYGITFGVRVGACLCDYTPSLYHTFPSQDWLQFSGCDSSSPIPARKDESSHDHGKEVWQDPMLDGTPSSRGQAAGEASWTLAQLRSSSHLGGILAVEVTALPSLPASWGKGCLWALAFFRQLPLRRGIPGQTR